LWREQVDESEALALVARLRPHGEEPLLPALAADVEWWVAGPPDILPWAGMFRGRDAVESWFEDLNATMDYQQFEATEFIAQGETVVVVHKARGVARSTRRPFVSEIVRIWTVRGGEVVRVRSYYDTHAYVAAVGAD
jgi:ketosteroid isomerase-like protein